MRKVKKKKLVCIKKEKILNKLYLLLYIKCLDIRLISFRVTYHPT